MIQYGGVNGGLTLVELGVRLILSPISKERVRDLPAKPHLVFHVIIPAKLLLAAQNCELCAKHRV